MALRRGIYMVPTSRWYIERTVWLIAGVVLIASTALAAWIHPLAVLGVIATGLVSINVALSGFCPIGTTLKHFGFPPMLESQKGAGSKLYFMQIDRWYLERRIYIAVGINISVASVLSLLISPWFLAFTGFVGVAMVWFAATGFCIMANGLYWLGAEPRLAPLAKTSCSATPRSTPQVEAEV